LRRCCESGKPFALLLPLTALEGQKRHELYRRYGLEVIFDGQARELYSSFRQGWRELVCYGLVYSRPGNWAAAYIYDPGSRGRVTTTATARKCPTCDVPLLPGDDGPRRILACLACGYTTDMADSREVALKLPGLDRGKQTVLAKEKEELVMQRIIGALCRAGCHVLSTVHRPKKHICSECRHAEWPRSGWGYGVSQGVPDVLCRRPDWPLGMWLGCEIKGPTTPLSDAQKALEAAGAIVVVRSEAEALDAVCRADERLKHVTPCNTP
jgi:hypothetical protein